MYLKVRALFAMCIRAFGVLITLPKRKDYSYVVSLASKYIENTILPNIAHLPKNSGSMSVNVITILRAIVPATSGIKIGFSILEPPVNSFKKKGRRASAYALLIVWDQGPYA